MVSGLTLVSSPLLSSGHGRSQPGSGSFIRSLHPRLRQQLLCRHSARKSRECAVQVRGSPAERLTPAVSTSTPTPESPLTHLYLMLAGKLAAVDVNSPIKLRRTGIYADINDVFSILLSSPKATRSINVSERLRTHTERPGADKRPAGICTLRRFLLAFRRLLARQLTQKELANQRSATLTVAAAPVGWRGGRIQVPEVSNQSGKSRTLKAGMWVCRSA